MASIKDVAKAAGVSFSTVSIVINGRARERKVSRETEARVWAAVKELGYTPNLSARNLRAVNNKRTIALFWATDFREVMSARFLAGLSQYIRDNNLDCEIIVRPYVQGRLNEERSFSGIAEFHGAIIATATPDDIRFLEEHEPVFPIVLYNRFSEKFSTVMVDDRQIGEKAAELFAELGHKSIALVKAPYTFDGMRVRDSVFIECCTGQGIKIYEYEAGENSPGGGYEMAREINFDKVTGVFLPSDAMAIGFQRRCHEKGILLPEYLSLLAIGNSVPVFSRYAIPSISVLDIPMEKMAERAASIISGHFSDAGNMSPVHEVIDVAIIQRESTGKARR